MNYIDAMRLAVGALELEDLACRYEKEPTPAHIAQAITALHNSITEAEKQEPVAYVSGYYNGRCVIKPLNRAMVLPVNMALYTAPPAAQRQPLTKERIGQIIAQCQITLVNYCSDEKQTEFARAIEAEHGIGEKK